MRGEHPIMQCLECGKKGSSPHARGTLYRELSAFCGCGIIPACAGNTRAKKFQIVQTRDHPRMRGEHCRMDGRNVRLPGSSPHARGTLRVFRWGGFLLGIIPACAGNTQSANRHRRLCRDHPRMRGEHAEYAFPRKPRRGSSPHARGTLFRHATHSLYFGIIPACAGNTWICLGNCMPRRDHPRMRGEHFWWLLE